MAPKKKNAAKKKAGTPAASPAASGSTVDPTALNGGSTSHTATPPPETRGQSPDAQEDATKAAEKTKDRGNTAFKAGKYKEAIDLYTEAIVLNPLEPAYLTNRAAAYMALKRFKPALEDCQQAMFILSPGSQSPSSSPPPNAAAQVKALLRLARCQYAVGSLTAAQASLARLLALEPTNVPAIQLKQKIGMLEGHVKNFETAYGRKDWAMARLALDKCTQSIEAEGGDVPAEWRVWKVELELARGSWEAASIGANEAVRVAPNSPDALALRGLVLFLTGKLPQALQHVQSALRMDPGHERAQKLRKRVKDVERLKEEGNVAFKTGKLQEAVDKYAEALEKIGQSEEEGKGGQIRATLLSNRATTLFKMALYEDALADVDQSLELFPHSFKALRTRARCNLNLEKYESAISDFKSAIQEASAEGTASDADVRALKQELKKAEVDFKRSKTKDYYKILGLSKECTESEIKKAYRRESLKHHPDKGGDEEQFKLVSEAYAVLSDSQKRFRYDQGDDEDGMGGDDDMHGHGMHGMSHMDLAELFAQFHGGFPRGGGGGGGRRGGGMGGMGGFPF
ncbi:hypothetical protein D9611_006095 [Ephemerocybe angulata]|uniref:J domain-containing protein n=1 Tax=Ephemerocybe angulata TaxID=980116 RepID=A0A8H5CGE9_9AGAR|nr:hypothetical protein D9611_006095 [Tulosesus angulatus]